MEALSTLLGALLALAISFVLFTGVVFGVVWAWNFWANLF